MKTLEAAAAVMPGVVDMVVPAVVPVVKTDLMEELEEGQVGQEGLRAYRSDSWTELGNSCRTPSTRTGKITVYALFVGQERTSLLTATRGLQLPGR